MSLTIDNFQKLVQDSTVQNKKVDIQDGKLQTTNKAQNNSDVIIDELRIAAEVGGWSKNQINSALTVLPKGKDVTVADLKKVLDKLNSMVNSMDVEKGAPDLIMLLALINKICLETRSTAQEASKKASELQVHFTHEQANKIAAAAGWALAASIVSGVFQIGSGAVVIGGAIIPKLAKAAKGGAEVVSGVGKIGEAILNYVSQLERANEVRAQADATKAGAAREEQLKFADNMQEAIRATLQAMQQAMQSREQSVQKIFA